MYTPSAFAETDQTKLHNFIEQHSFATLVTVADGVPTASHLPLLLDRQAGEHGMLIGHMARANPQWKNAEGQQTLTIFHGPHAYISPAWYEDSNVVPTWNYAAVHVHGTFQLDDTLERRSAITRAYVDHYESSRSQPWTLSGVDADFIDRLVEAIVGFRIPIDHMEGKWKLSQNHDESRRARVIDALKDSVREDDRAIADLMIETMTS